VANDRQLYLASWGLFLALCIQVRTTPIWAIVAALFAVASVLRQLDYRSEIALWESSVALAPWNARGHNNLGYAYQLAGRIEDARREYHAALLFDPRHQKAWFNLHFLPPARN
jgi:tetratricopeptide (TPR) repeat protein